MINYENENLQSDFKCKTEMDTLELGIYTLGLLPADCLPTLIYITDGITFEKDLQKTRECCRVMSRDYINFGIIQVGSSSGFSPMMDLGHVTNREYLRLLSDCTWGSLMYAEAFPYIEEELKISSKPNIYQNLYSMRNFRLTSEKDSKKFRNQFEEAEKSVDTQATKLIDTDIEERQETLREEENYPWAKDSIPPTVVEIFCLHRGYKIKVVSLKRLLQARLNEGFHVVGIKCTKSTLKKQNVKITLQLPLAINYRVQYTVKFSWDADKPDRSKLINYYPTSRPMKIELSVIAHHSFAVFFLNIHNVDTIKGDSINDEIYLQLNQLHALLKAISEVDETLQVPEELITGERAAKSLFTNTEVNRTRYQVASMFLSRYLLSWADITLTRYSHAKWVYDETHTPSGYCLLNISWQTESLMIIVLQFFSCTMEEKLQIIHNFKRDLMSLQHINRTNQVSMYPIYPSIKPSDGLLICYSPMEDGLITQPGTDDIVSELFRPNVSPARTFLRNIRWVWFSDLNHNENHKVLAFNRIFESSFILLYNSKSNDGFLRLAETPGTVTFYKEIEISKNEYCSVQYIILWNPDNYLLATELWVEPNREVNEQILKEYFVTYSKQVFSSDCALLMQLFAFDYTVNKSMIHIQSRFTDSENCIYVPTIYHLPLLMQNSYFSYNLYNLHPSKNLDCISQLQGILKDKNSFNFNLPTLESVQPVDLSKKEYCTDICLVENIYLQDRDAIDFNSVILGYFTKYLSVNCSEWVQWPSKTSPKAIIDQIADQLNEIPISFPKFSEAQLFIKIHDTEKVIIVALPNIDSINFTSIAIAFVVCVRQNLFFFNTRSNTFKLSYSAIPNANDGTTLFQGHADEKMLDIKLKKFEYAGVATFQFITNSDSTDSQEYSALEVISEFTRCFEYSIAKTAYLKLLLAKEISKDEYNRLQSVVISKKIALEATDFEGNVKIAAILKQNFAYASAFVNGGKDIYTYFHAPKIDESKTLDDMKQLLGYSNTPMLISFSVKYHSPAEEITVNCSDGIFLKRSDLNFSNPKDLVHLPHHQSDQKVEIILEIYYLPLESDEFLLTNTQKEAIQCLKESIYHVFQDIILAEIIRNSHLSFDEHVIHYTFSSLQRRHYKTDTLTIRDQTDFKVTHDSSMHFQVDMHYLDAECKELFELDLVKCQIFNNHIVYSGHCFYLTNDSRTNKFWLLINSSSIYVDIYFFTLETTAVSLSILQNVYQSIQSCQKSANQRYLLKELYETHLARDGLDFFPEETSTRDNILHSLACPLQLEKRFTIHWRIRPVQVLNNIMNSMQGLAVSNRKSVLAFSSSFYVILEPSDSEELDRGSKLSLDTKSAGTSKKDFEKYLTVYVYGLEKPSSDISVDFLKIIDNKIESVTQNVLGTFLARNSTARLTKADLDFIMPCNVEPYYFSYLLVKELENPHLFIVLLRQAMLLFLQQMSGNDLCTLLKDYYKSKFGQDIIDEPTKNTSNELHIGDMSFIYNCVSSRRLNALETAVGEGIISITLTPFDRNNSILFPSAAPLTLWNNKDVVLDNKSFYAKHTLDEHESRQWEGYKIGVTLWKKGPINLKALVEKIDLTFQHTLVDYTVESYYRSTAWHTLPNKNRLPELPPVDKSKSKNGLKGKPAQEFLQVTSTLPQILEKGASILNPVIQSIKISSKLPVDTIACGIRGTLSDEELQAYFFNNTEGSLILIDQLMSASEGKEKSEIPIPEKRYVIVGAVDIYSPPDRNEGPRRQSAASDGSGGIAPGSPRLSTIKLARHASNDSVSDADQESISTGRRGSLTKLQNGDFEEIFMFPDAFYPYFPIYGKRSTFFVVSLEQQSVSVSTYNWKKSESDKFFLKMLKILNWAKINQQFITRKESYTGKQLAKFTATTSKYGPQLFTFSDAALRISGPFAAKFRELDFIYHIGGYDAVHLQTQIVDFLELFFRFGNRPIGSAHITKSLSDISHESSLNPLSLKEMSEVLQSLELIHSSSSPIFFSECRSDLLSKWESLAYTNNINSVNLLSLGKSISALTPKLTHAQLQLEERWFKDLISEFLDQYVEYLEHLGMEKARVDMTSHESGKFGGAFAINAETLVETPSLFLRKYFPSGVILVQCGFYSYFATVNVLTFAYNTTDSVHSKDDDFLIECSNITKYSHIVSFSYDFHLRYIRNILNLEQTIDLPVDLVRVLRTFVSLNPRKARFCRNRIANEVYRSNLIKNELFRYIMKHPSLYGFKSIMFKGECVAFGITLDNLNTDSGDSVSDFTYSLVICGADNAGEVKENDLVELEFFALVVNRMNSFPYKEFESSPSSQLDDNPLHEYISSGYYLQDIVTLSKKRIDDLLEKVVKDYGRDNLWAQLRQESFFQSSLEWSRMFLEKISPNIVNVCSMDSTLNELFNSNLPWQSILIYLVQAHQKFARYLNGPDDRAQHLILFNPANEDYLLYLRLRTAENTTRFEMFAISREGIRDPVEYVHINDTVNSILFWIWNGLSFQG
ncbi:hypothetical protein HDV01_001295 [Terramyces sp. JEL0728]|nr:hypothetical protein HDV01_001295 [Terramyces sp. JEL0728]